MIESTLIAEIAVGDELGEGVLWCERRKRFFWTDIQGKRLHSVDGNGEKLGTYALPNRLASFGFRVDHHSIIAAFDRYIATYDLVSGSLVPFVFPPLPPGVRFNDGRVDRHGRFTVGTMVEDPENAGGTDKGQLLRLMPNGDLIPLLDGIKISNALCWSPDAKVMYHVDTPVGELNSYYDHGSYLEYRRGVKRYGPLESPDGATVDAAGNIWLAVWGAGRIDCLNPDGTLTGSINVPVSQPTCVAFGGRYLNRIGVTTAWQGLGNQSANNSPRAGNFFIFEVNAKGQPEEGYAQV